MNRRARFAAALLAAAVLLGASVTLVTVDAKACGFCHGDKVAIVYDHATVLKAIKDGKAVEFADVEGGFMNADAQGIAAMKNAVGSVKGVQADTIKVSSNPTAVAFVFDPKLGSAADFLKRINNRLAQKKWTLTHLRTIDKDHP